MTRSVVVLTCAALALALAGVGSAGGSGSGVKVERGVVFCRPGGVELRMDVARPEGEGPWPGIVFVHGGAWIGGDRSVYGGEVVDFARHGFVVATLDYRLLDPDAGNVARHPFPAALDDVRCGVRFLRAHAGRFALDPARIGATGHSAGGHLSLLAGVADAPARDGEEWPRESGRVQAVVNQSGPTDLEALWESPSDVRPILTMLLPGPAESRARRFAAASPVTFASADDPPVLTLHGELDPQVPVEQARLLDRALRAVRVRHELVVLPGERHGFSAKAYGANQERIRAFFARELAPRPGAAAD